MYMDARRCAHRDKMRERGRQKENAIRNRFRDRGKKSQRLKQQRNNERMKNKKPEVNIPDSKFHGGMFVAVSQCLKIT